MRYNLLGKTGLYVSELCLGAMTFGAGSGIWGEIAGLDREQATRLVGIAVDHGINLVDTADPYSQGKSEELVGQVLLDLGLQTVRSYRKTMMKKLGVNNVAGLTQLALAAGITHWNKPDANSMG